MAEIIQDTTVDVPTRTMQARIRREFERHRGETNLDVINALIFKGTAELIESVNVWKQKGHVMNYFDNNSLLQREHRERLNFADKFFSDPTE